MSEATDELVQRIVASAHLVSRVGTQGDRRLVRIAYAGNYSELPDHVRWTIETRIERTLGLTGWRLAGIDEVDDAGELWCYTTKRSVPDPDVTRLAFTSQIRN